MKEFINDPGNLVILGMLAVFVAISVFLLWMHINRPYEYDPTEDMEKAKNALKALPDENETNVFMGKKQTKLVKLINFCLNK